MDNLIYVTSDYCMLYVHNMFFRHCIHITDYICIRKFGKKDGQSRKFDWVKKWRALDEWCTVYAIPNLRMRMPC